MNKKLSLFIFFALSLSAFAQTAGGEWKWARAFGGGDESFIKRSNFIRQVESDTEGNTYILGLCGSRGGWDNGQPIVNNSTVAAGDQTAMILAKFDSVGTLLWSKVVRNSSDYSGYIGMQLTDSNLIVAGTTELLDPEEVYGRPQWLFFFDTLIRSQDVIATPVEQRHPPFDFGWWTFVTTLDLDGNRESTVILEKLARPEYRMNGLRFHEPFILAIGYPEGFFHKDSEGNYVFVLQEKVRGDADDPYSVLVHKQDMPDSSNSFMTDTFNTFYPTSTDYMQDAVAHLSFYKFSPTWQLITFRILVQGSDGIPASYEIDLDSINTRLKYGINGFDLDDDGNYYIAGELGLPFTDNFHGDLNNYPCHIYFDSSIYLTVNHINETFRPSFVLKIDPNGVPLWCNQIHVHSNERAPFSIHFLGIDVSGSYIYIPVRDGNYTTIVPDLGEFDKYRGKIGWLKCDKETGTWQHYAISDTLDALTLHRVNNFVHEDHVFVTGQNAYDNSIEHWTTDGTLIDTLNISGQSVECDWATIDNQGNLRWRRTVMSSQDFGSIHLNLPTSWSRAVIALYHNDAFAVPYHREEQSIIWEQELNFTLADSPVTLTATSTSGLPVSYSSSDTSIARIDGSTLHLLAGGSCTILATCPDNDYYQPAAPVSKTLTVGQSGIADHEASPLLIYPNPSRGYMNLYGPTDQISSITLYDMAGREVYHHTRTIFLNATPADQGPCYSLNISHLPQGSYIVKVSTADGRTQHLKVVKK